MRMPLLGIFVPVAGALVAFLWPRTGAVHFGCRSSRLFTWR